MLDEHGFLLSGPSSLAELAALLERLVALDGSQLHLRVRVIAVPDTAAGWQLFAGRLDLTAAAEQAEAVVNIGPVRLITSSVPIDTAIDPEHIRALLLAWLGELRLDDSTAHAQDTTNAYRSPSPDAHLPPSWRCDLHQHRGGNSCPVRIEGPFLHEPLGLMARSVGELAAQWLDLPWLSDNMSPSSHIVALLPDPRAALGAIEVTSDAIRLTVRRYQLGTSLRVLAFLTDSSSRILRSLSPCSEATVHLAFAERLRAIELYLLDASGVCLDSFNEDENRCSRDERVLYAVATSAEDDLHQALASGEGDHVEFKAWLPLNREDSKSLELFTTVCAFANAGGGSLYIGVTAELQLHTLDPAIRRAFGTPADPIEEQRERYSNTLLRHLREGIAPNVQVEANWISSAGNQLLRITVAQSPTRDHFVLENRKFYVRRGASSAAALPTDLRPSAGGGFGPLGVRRRRLGA